MRVLAFTLLTLVPCFASGQSPDSEVVAAAFRHFADRTDTFSLHEAGLILVQPQTLSITPDLAVSVLGDVEKSGECSGLTRFAGALASQNGSSVSVAPLLLLSSRWRAMVDTDPPRSARYLDETISGEKIETMVWLTVPAYSGDGSSALVYLRFRWSMLHAADARYLIQRTPDGWGVKCSSFAIYP
jgi:hypothetical protein